VAWRPHCSNVTCTLPRPAHPTGPRSGEHLRTVSLASGDLVIPASVAGGAQGARRRRYSQILVSGPRHTSRNWGQARPAAVTGTARDAPRYHGPPAVPTAQTSARRPAAQNNSFAPKQI